MTRHEHPALFRHMLEHAQEALNLADGKCRADLDNDRMLELSLTRLLEVVGEAAARVPKPKREELPHIPWLEIVGLRNRLIHGYDEVDLDILWDVIQIDLPNLVAALDKIDEK